MNNLFKRFGNDIKGVVWVATGLLVGLSLMSYSAQDPSLNSIGKAVAIRNYCGYFGAFLADFLYQALGLAAWVVAFGPIRRGVQAFRGQARTINRFNLSVAALLLITSASLFALYLPEIRIGGGALRPGGEIGRLIAKGMVTIFNPVGVGVILWTAALVLLVFYTERPLSDLMRQPLWLMRRPIRVIFSGWWQSWREYLLQLKAGLRQRQLALATEVTSSPTPPANERFFNLRREAPGQGPRLEVSPEDEPPVIESAVMTTAPRRKLRLPAQAPRRVENWNLPKISLLEDPPAARARVDEKEIRNKARLLVEKLAQFSIQGEVVGIKPGPAVTLFEFKPAADVKISRITDLADDLSLALSSESVRIIAPIPGRDVVGIETSNAQRESVFLKDIVTSEAFWNDECKLPLPLGRRADGEPRVVDLRKMPHLLVAGTTGSGKSVFVVSALTALLFRHSPKTLKLILVDPKQVDLAAFASLPHLIMPPIREPRKAVGALRWAIREMEKRYRSMSRFGARGIESFNEIVADLTSEEIRQHEEYNQVTDGPPKQDNYYFTQLPYICIVVEEFGDLMAVDKINVEQAVVRLAQMARACGIHLILAMQSPRKDVVTGLIKTNIPGRISFKVASKMDSRIILDEGGAERLLARGDMLFLAPGVSKPERHHGPFLSEAEISAVVSSWREQGAPEFDPLALKCVEGSFSDGPSPLGEDSIAADGETPDDRYDEVLAYVSTMKEVSASLLQRKFRLGYPRAARMIEIFESEGVVGPANGSKPRQVLIKELK